MNLLKLVATCTCRTCGVTDVVIVVIYEKTIGAVCCFLAILRISLINIIGRIVIAIIGSTTTRCAGCSAIDHLGGSIHLAGSAAIAGNGVYSAVSAVITGIAIAGFLIGAGIAGFNFSTCRTFCIAGTFALLKGCGRHKVEAAIGCGITGAFKLDIAIDAVCKAGGRRIAFFGALIFVCHAARVGFTVFVHDMAGIPTIGSTVEFINLP